MITFHITRDSYCMADDVDAPHLKKIILESPSQIKTEQLIDQILKSYRAPHFPWRLLLNEVEIATSATNGHQLLTEKVNLQERKNFLHFEHYDAKARREKLLSP